MQPSAGFPHPIGGSAAPSNQSTTWTITVNATINAPTDGAKIEMQNAAQGYVDNLCRESEKQEISRRPPGVMFPEVTGNSVVRAKEALNKHGLRAKPSALDALALFGVPICSSYCGILGTYFHSFWQIASFSGSAFIGTACVVYLIVRRFQ